MKQLIVCLFMTVILFTAGSKVFSQEVLNAPNPLTPYYGCNTSNPSDVTGMTTKKEYSARANQLVEQIRTLRESNSSNKVLLEQLNLELAAETGNEVIVTPTPDMEVHPAPANSPEVQSDFIGNTLIASNSAFRGLATFTEQGTATAGKIWAAYCVNSTTDTLKVYYSTTGGVSWVYYGYLSLGTGNDIQQDMLDMEVIGNTTGSVFVYVSYCYKNSGGDQKVGLLDLSAPTFGGTSATLSWPGAATSQYYDLRITSDNATFPNLAYLYLACSFDSTAGSNHVLSQKTARITSPYNTTMTFSYKTTRMFWAATSADIQRAYTDICYFKNTSDSIELSFCGVRDSTAIFFQKADINGSDGNSAGAGGFIKGTETTAEKKWGRISSNGNNNGSIFFVYNLTIPGDNQNVKYLRTTNSGNFNTIAGQSTLLGSSVGTNYQPDIVGRRNTNMHYFAYHTIDSLYYGSVTSGGSITLIRKMNTVSTISSSQGSKPGFRNVSGDSCLVLYPESGPTNVWVAVGCSGSTVGVQNLQIPAVYELAQNYPNPFNPSTSIRYAIPVKGAVKISIFNTAGKEVATLVNGVKEAGSYIVDFNASGLSSGVYFYKLTAENFSEVKKMMLIK